MALDRIFYHLWSRFILSYWSLGCTHMPITSIDCFTNSDGCLYRICHQFLNIYNSFVEKVLIPLHDSKSRTILCLLFWNNRPMISFEINRCICKLLGAGFFGAARRSVFSTDSNRKNVKTWLMMKDRRSFCGSWRLKTKLTVPNSMQQWVSLHLVNSSSYFK